MAWLIYVSANPLTPILGRNPGTTAFRSLEEYPDGETYPGVLVMRFDGALFFVTTDALEDRLRQAVLSSAEPITAVVVDFAGVNFIDSQGSAVLGEIKTLADSAGISLRLARVKPNVLAVLWADGVADRIGPERLHDNVDQAVRAELDARATGNR
ncbi:MAG: sodium-independent anion transporter [Acidimicrobiia bacterium]|nr:sodium-independent anion transporter [Acidimicrobiia bacterium]